MLDAKSTFDDAISRYARDGEQARSILASRLYRNVRDTMSGTQEYMAVEKLYQLHEDGGFDLIVVDTPPTRRALDFVNAPGRLTRLLHNPAFRIMVTPTRAYLRTVTVVTQPLWKAATRTVGAEMVADTVAFLQAFQGMESGIRTRADRVLELFAQPSTAFVLVVAPRPDSVAESLFFAERLGRSDIPVQALIVNRLHPRFDVQPNEAPAAALGGLSDRARTGGDSQAFEVLRGNWEQFRIVAEREENCFAALAAQLAPAPVARVPFLAADVHDLDGVQTVADHLFGPARPDHPLPRPASMP
jgi:anion-transporting  ArsA/GET3 family ATPase